MEWVRGIGSGLGLTSTFRGCVRDHEVGVVGRIVQGRTRRARDSSDQYAGSSAVVTVVQGLYGRMDCRYVPAGRCPRELGPPGCARQDPKKSADDDGCLKSAHIDPFDSST